MGLTRLVSVISLTALGALPSIYPSAKAATMCTGGTPITGFRGAHLGATKAQVLAAVARDFPTLSPRLTPSNDKSVVAYELVVPQLNPGPGLARVAYLFDSATDTLSAVNIAWRSSAIPSDDARQAIANAGLRLQAFLLREPRGCIANKGATIDATSALLYHAEDAAGSFVELVAGGISLTTSHGTSTPRETAWLRLTYSTRVAQQTH